MMMAKQKDSGYVFMVFMPPLLSRLHSAESGDEGGSFVRERFKRRRGLAPDVNRRQPANELKQDA
jgi:hypothetical protein